MILNYYYSSFILSLIPLVDLLEVGLIVVAVLIIAVFGLMVLNNVVSAIRMDVKTALLLVDDEEIGPEVLKKNWWRDERSAKTWKLFDQFQFISFYVIANVVFPSRLISFTKFFNWSNFGTSFLCTTVNSLFS
jgi:hypothetical protein